MRLLLDTHVLLWWLADAPQLGADHRALIHDGQNDVFVSAVSVAEISIKASLGKLDAPQNVAEAIIESGFTELDFTVAHGETLRSLPWHHRDPFDRMLVAQALVEGLTLLTLDSRVREYFSGG